MRDTITISVPRGLRKELDAMAKEEGVSRSDLVRECLRRELFLKGIRAFRERMIPRAQKMGIYTDEDVFKIVS